MLYSNIMVLLFDIGGTKMRFATSYNENEIKDIKFFDTPKNYEEGINNFKNYYKSINEPEIKMVSGGIAGPLNKEKSMVINAPNLPGWNNKPFKKDLEDFFNKKVIIENDAALVGLGEAFKGAGENREIVVFYTISTGVGGARIVNGKIDKSSMGFEPGHQYIPLKNSNDLIHLEGLISGTALKKKYSMNPENITDENVWDECSYYLALGIHNSILFWSPNVVVLGGSIMNKIDVEYVRRYLKQVMKIFPNIPDVEKAQLGDKAGLYGALKLYQNSTIA